MFDPKRENLRFIQGWLAPAFPEAIAVEAAEKLVGAYGSLANLLQAPADSLIRLVGEKVAFYIRCCAEAAVRAKAESFRFGVSHPTAEIIEYLLALYSILPNETVFALLLSHDRKVVKRSVISVGTVNSSSVIPRKVCEEAVANDAGFVILSHNHPGGIPKPSSEDIAITLGVENALHNVGVHLLAHYVFSSAGYEDVYDRINRR